MNAAHGRNRGFTLLEALLSVALLAALLAALNLFVFSMGEIWGRNRQDRLFEQHARAVSRHVEDLLRRAAAAPGEAAPRIAATPSLAASSPLLVFDLPAGDRSLPWPATPLPDVRCALQVVPDRGLVLHWQSRWETDFEKVAPRTLVLSPLVTRLEYAYDVDGRWVAEETPRRDKRGEFIVPARVVLRFEHRGRTSNLAAGVPRLVGALPSF